MIRADTRHCRTPTLVAMMQATVPTTIRRNQNKVTKHVGIYVKRGRRDWIELGFYDRTVILDSEIDAAILAESGDCG